MKIPQNKRLIRLNAIAKKQMDILRNNNTLANTQKIEKIKN